MRRLCWRGGAVLVLAACGPAREAEFHLLDSGAGALLALDARGIVLRSEPWPGARLLAVDGEALWIAGDAAHGGRLERRVLDAPEAPPASALPFRAPLALAPGPQGDLYVLDGSTGARERLWRVEPWMTTRFLGEFADASVLTWDGGSLLLGTRTGQLLRLRRDGAVLDTLELGAPLVALQAAPEESGLFVLLGGTTPRLVRLERSLAPSWSAALTLPCEALAVADGRAWVVEGERLLRFDASGGHELELALPARGGPWQASLARGSRAWLRGRGAWLEIESAGTRAWIARSQGGFEALSAAVRRRAGAAPRRAGSSRRARPPARGRGSS